VGEVGALRERGRERERRPQGARGRAAGGGGAAGRPAGAGPAAPAAARPIGQPDGWPGGAERPPRAPASAADIRRRWLGAAGAGGRRRAAAGLRELKSRPPRAEGAASTRATIAAPPIGASAPPSQPRTATHPWWLVSLRNTRALPGSRLPIRRAAPSELAQSGRWNVQPGAAFVRRSLDIALFSLSRSTQKSMSAASGARDRATAPGWGLVGRRTSSTRSQMERR
jgi:hypothetical protein